MKPTWDTVKAWFGVVTPDEPQAVMTIAIEEPAPEPMPVEIVAVEPEPPAIEPAPTPELVAAPEQAQAALPSIWVGR